MTPDPRPGFFGSQVWWSVFRGRALRVGVAVLLTGGMGIALYATWLYGRARSSECDTWAAVDPSMEELIAVRKRIQAYQRDPSPDAALVLSGEEITFLIGEMPDFAMRASFVGSEVAARVAIPSEEGCYNIDFRGTVDVDAGVAIVRPSHLVVGDADLTFWLGGRRIVVEPSRIGQDRVASTLDNVAWMRVDGGAMHVQLDNRWDLW